MLRFSQRARLQLPEFTDPAKAVEFLNDSDFVSEVVPNWYWSEELQMAAAVVPGEVRGTLRPVSREELLQEANEVLKEIVDSIRATRTEGPTSEIISDLIEKWFPSA